MALVLAALAFEAVLFAFHLAAGSLALTSTIVYDALFVGAALLCALRALSSRTERLAWAVMACAIACWATGEIYYDAFLAQASGPQPIPSVADIFWLLFYIPAYLSVVLLIRSRLPQLSASLWIDGVIGGLGVASVSAAVVFDAVLHSASGSFGVVATGLAYPVGDLVLRGRSEPLRAWEPLPPERFEGAATTQYSEAFAKLEAGDVAAMPAFAALVGLHADDALAGFHLRRLLNGAKGVSMKLE